MKDTVCIIGSHPRTNKAFDFNRTDCEIWVFNEAISNKTFKSADAVFQIHAEPIWRNPANRNDSGHVNWLQTQTAIPVFMQEAYPDVPMAKKYPLEGVLDMVHNDPAHLLSSSVALAVAYACYLGIYKRIEVWGVAMETNTEYQFQREGVAFWKGFAMGRGIDFYFADPTFECPIYGYEGAVAIEYERFGERVNELKPDLEKLSQEYAGAIVNIKQALNLLANDGSKEVEDALFASVTKQRELGDKLGFLDGAIQENQRYQMKADAMLKAAQKFIFSRQEFESGLASLTKKANELNVEFISAGTKLDIIHQNAIKAAKGSPKRKNLMEMYAQNIQAYLNLNNQIAIYRGAANENGLYMNYLDKHIKAAGGAKSEAVLLESMQNAQ